MRNYRLLLLFCPLLAFCQQAEQSLAPLQTVDRVEIERYAGLWYEIARLPNRFQRNCNSNTTAEYRLRDDGRIDVINSCRRQDGSTNEAQAIARIVDKQSNAKLQVSFVRFLGISLFWGDYWIIGLDA
ncbi:MAG TPA: lipocalin family protein, partial [bacterium]|nr:lipocalin family protein [bacterium]